MPSFLSLPAELQIAIYSYIVPTHFGFSYRNYRGLYTSCKTIQREMGVECPRHFQKALDELQKHDQIFLLEAEYFNGKHFAYTPTTFPQLNNIEMHVHVDLARYWPTYILQEPGTSPVDKMVVLLGHWSITMVACLSTFV